MLRALDFILTHSLLGRFCIIQSGLEKLSAVILYIFRFLNSMPMPTPWKVAKTI